MQALDILAIFLSLCDHVQGAAGGINYRCASDTDFRKDIRRSTHIGARDSGDPGGRIDEADLPQRGEIRVGIERVYTIVLRCHVYHVMESLPRDADVGDV